MLLVLLPCLRGVQFSLKAGLRQSVRLRALYRDLRRSVHLFDDKHCAWVLTRHGQHR